MKNIVITGATSFIGTHLINEWLNDDCTIYAIVRPNSKNMNRIPSSKKIHVLGLEMAQYDKLPELIPSADYFYHLSWEGARAPYRDDDVLQKTNFVCAVKAIEAADKIGCTFFLGTGSQAEYGRIDGVVRENHPCEPNTAYGREKLHACKALSIYASDHQIRFIWTRIFSLYGVYDYPGTLIMSSIEKMKKNIPVEMTPATQFWDYLNVIDAAKAMKLFAESNCENGIYNLASGEYMQLRKFVKCIKTVLKSESELLFGAIPYGSNGPVNLMPDVAKIKNALNWKPQISFENGIRELISN